MGLIDFERGAKIAGSRFDVLRGRAARLRRALIAWMLDLQRERGFDEVYVPFVVKEEMLGGIGHLVAVGAQDRRVREPIAVRRAHHPRHGRPAGRQRRLPYAPGAYPRQRNVRAGPAPARRLPHFAACDRCGAPDVFKALLVAA